MPRRARILLSLLVCALSACGARATVSPLVPADRAAERAAESVRRATVKAERAAEPASPYWLLARLNRAGCDCPAWEVRIWGTWRRADLIFGEAQLPPTVDAAESPDGTRVWVLASEADNDRVREDGRRFLRFEVSQASLLEPHP